MRCGSKSRRAGARSRVLLLTADYPPRPWSGIGRAVERQADALAGRGLQVDVLIGDDRWPRRRIDHRPRGVAGPVVRALPRGRFPVEAGDFDCVHLHSLRLAELALELRRRYGTRLVYTVHGLIHREMRPCQMTVSAVRRAALMQKNLLATCDRIVFLSQAERQEGCRLVPAAAPRSVVIGNGLQAPRSGLPRGPRRGPIVYAGRFAHSKGIELLGEVVPRLMAAHDAGVVLAGGHGDAAGKAVIDRLGRRRSARLRCPGWLGRSALANLFQAASLVLVPSLYEPFGQVALEAMSFGAPVLAADVGGLRDLVRPGSGGHRLAPVDGARWSRRALAMVRDRQLSNRLADQGPTFVAEHFAIERVAERLEQEAYGYGRAA